MSADAVDTAVTLGWALLVWIVLTAAAAVAAVYAVVVAVAAPVNAAREALSGALAASGALRALRPLPESPDASEGLLSAPGSDRAPAGGPSSATSCRQNAPQASGAPFPAPTPERASEARLCPRIAPSWARTEREAA